MKLAYLIPGNTYHFFQEIVPYLEKLGVEVQVNRIEGADIILAAILPATPEWADKIAVSGKPYVLWHWDDYSFVDKTVERWSNFFYMMRKASQIWSCGYEVARRLKQDRGYDSVMIPAWVNSTISKVGVTGNYVLYVSSSGAFGKRVEWATRTCEHLKIPLELTQGQYLPRDEYESLIQSCRVYLMPAFEESNGTIPAMEAGACGRPVVCADLPNNLEVFGRLPGVFYFPVNDFGEMLIALRAAWDCGFSKPLMDKMLELFSVERVARMVVQQLRGICHA